MSERSATAVEGGFGRRPARVSASTSLAEVVADDERSLREGRPGVRVGVLSDRGLSVGVATRMDEAYVARVRSAGIGVVRRTTGGTGVLHLPGDLVWSVVLDRRHPAVGRDFVRGFNRLGAGVVRWLASLGVTATWADPPALSRDCCFLSDRGQVLVVDGRVLGGAAQHLTSARLLHQGAIATSVDRARVAEVFALDERALDRLTSLRDLAIPGEPVAWARALAPKIDEETERPPEGGSA